MFALEITGPHWEIYGCKPMMHGHRQSDEGVVPAKSPNKSAQVEAEGMEGRPSAKGNVSFSVPCPGHSAGKGMSVTWERIRRAKAPAQRHDLRQEPDAVIPPVRI